MAKFVKHFAVILISGITAYTGMYFSVALATKNLPGTNKTTASTSVKPPVKIKKLRDNRQVIDTKKPDILVENFTKTDEKRPAENADKPLAVILTEKKLSSNPDLTIRVDKSDRKLMLYSGKVLIKTYDIALGPSPAGGKTRESDGKTPEGTYRIVEKIDRGLAARLGSRWMRINYPNIQDANSGYKNKAINKITYNAIAEAVKNNAIPPQSTALGGGLGLHGASGRGTETRGCVGLTNSDIEEIYAFVKTGTTVIIER